MSALDTDPVHAAGHHGDEGELDHDTLHITVGGYVTGFVLAVILTAIPFWLVMGKIFANPTVTTFVILGFAIVQIYVHMVFFLHMTSKAEGGWTWKFDPNVFARDHLTPELLTRLDCRVALFRAEHGLVTPQQGEVLYDRLGRVAPVIEIPVAGHHIMLDQPVALVAALRTLLADWDHSIPHG